MLITKPNETFMAITLLVTFNKEVNTIDEFFSTTSEWMENILPTSTQLISCALLGTTEKAFVIQFQGAKSVLAKFIALYEDKSIKSVDSISDELVEKIANEELTEVDISAFLSKEQKEKTHKQALEIISKMS